MNKAWRVQWLQYPHAEYFYACAGTASKVRYLAYLTVSDMHDRVNITEFRVTRAPEYDEIATRTVLRQANGKENIGSLDRETGERDGCCLPRIEVPV